MFMKMLKLFFYLTLICGVIYPLSVTVIAKIIFPHKASGSLITNNEKIVGSELLAQKFTEARYFHPRPSAGDYATVSSGASQFSPTSKTGMEQILQRKSQFPNAGLDFWTTSGSGLDPHISPQSAFAQVDRIATTLRVTPKSIKALIERHIEGPTLGIWGQPRVNVLKLNLDLLSEGKDANTR